MSSADFTLYPTQNFEFPLVRAIRFWYLPVTKWRYNTTPPNFSSGKLGILIGMETIRDKQLGPPVFPSQFPTHRIPHNTWLFWPPSMHTVNLVLIPDRKSSSLWGVIIDRIRVLLYYPYGNAATSVQRLQLLWIRYCSTRYSSQFRMKGLP